MKLLSIVVLLCLCIFGSGMQTDTIWGNVNPNSKQIGTESISIPSTIWTVKTHTFTFPKVFFGIFFLFLKRKKK